jgi:hypothetical protein
MGPRADGANDFFRLSGGKNELHMLWWLFHNFQERIEPLLGDHVGLIEDENLVAIARRCIHRALAKVSRVINTVVAGGVNLDNIERSPAIPG